MERKLKRIGWRFLLPELILLAGCLIYPIIYSVYLSFTSTKGIVTKFVAGKNYIKLLHDPMFFLALRNTFRILIIQVPVMLILALFLAFVLNDKTLKCKGLFRTAIFMPAVTSLIAYTILFKMLFAYDGMINHVLLSLHWIKEPIGWLMKEGTAIFVLILAMIWRWTGYNMVFYLSAMQNISDDIYEASAIDGATKIKQFFYITLPLLKPMILFTTIMSTIGTLQLFDEPMNLSQGGVTSATVGPGNCFLTLSVYMYNTCFKYTPNFGYAATISYATVFLIALLSVIQFWLAGSEARRERRMK